MNLIAKIDGIDADEWIDWPESDDDASPYDFTVWNGLLFVGRTYRGRTIFAPASIIHGGIADGRFLYTKDPRKRVKIEPSDPTLIDRESMPRNRNVLWAPRHRQPIPTFDRGHFRRDGASLVAHWQFQRVGNASPAVTHKVGTDLSREQLDRIARPFKKGRAVAPWNAHAKHIAWNWKKHWQWDGARVEENAKRYRRRLDAVTKSYDDLLRWNSKCTCGHDVTRETTAYIESWQRAARRFPSPWPDFNAGHHAPAPHFSDGRFIEYEPELPRREKVPQPIPANLGECWRTWVMIAWWLLWHQETIWPEQPRPKPRHWCAFLEGRHDKITGHTIGNGVLSERDYLSDECIKRSGRVKAQSRKRVTLLKPDEILAAVLAAQQGVEARNKLIDHFRPGIARMAESYASAANPVQDLINQAIAGTPSENGEVTNGLLYAIDRWDHKKGAFPDFAMKAVRWAILKYIEKQPPQHVSLNAKVNPDDDEDGDTWQDMIVAEAPDHGEECEAA